jgi:hypothetical protein
MQRALLLTVILVATACSKKPAPPAQARPIRNDASSPPVDLATQNIAATAQPYTDVFLHDVKFLETGGVSLDVSWMSGRMYPAEKGVTPSLDNPQSFTLDVQNGLVSISLFDVAKLLNTRVLKGSSLSDVKLTPRGNQLQITGTLHKVVPLPIQVLADVGVSAGGQHIVLHIAKAAGTEDAVGGPAKSVRCEACPVG